MKEDHEARMKLLKFKETKRHPREDHGIAPPSSNIERFKRETLGTPGSKWLQR